MLGGEEAVRISERELVVERLSGFFQSEVVSYKYEQLQILSSLWLPITSSCKNTVLLYWLTRIVLWCDKYQHRSGLKWPFKFATGKNWNNGWKNPVLEGGWEILRWCDLLISFVCNKEMKTSALAENDFSPPRLEFPVFSLQQKN